MITSIDFNFTIEEVDERFAVKWERDQAASDSEDFPSANGDLRIRRLAPETVYTINVTAHLRGGQERESVVKVMTNSKWCECNTVFLARNVTISGLDQVYRLVYHGTIGKYHFPVKILTSTSSLWISHVGNTSRVCTRTIESALAP